MSALNEAASAWTLKDVMYGCGVVVAVISAGVAVFAACRTQRRDLVALGDYELKMFDMIASAELAYANFNFTILEKKKNDPGYEISSAENVLTNHHIERVLNVYDIHCQRYLDKKLDTARFKKTYGERIKKICDSTVYKEKMNETSFNYTALKTVNTEMNNPEKRK